MFYLTDRALISDFQESGDRLVVNARVARGGNVQEYLGSELGITDRRFVKVYRPMDEVFDKDSLKTFPHKFVTMDHPAGASVFDRDAVGWIGDEVMRDGEFIRIPMTIAHRKAVDAVKGGKRELSVGYATEIVFEDGVSPGGEAYDAKMTKIVVDHVAIVDRARGGTELRIGDWRASDESDLTPNTTIGGHNMADSLRKVVLDGLTIETTEQGAQAIDKLNKQVADAKAAADSVKADSVKALAAKDAELAKKDAEIDSLKGKVLTDAQLDEKVKARADLIATARSIVDADYTGKSDAEIRKAVVVAKCGDSMKEKPEAYIAVRFDVLAEDAAKDPVRKALQTQDRNFNPQDNGQAAYEARLQNAWKGNATKEAV